MAKAARPLTVEVEGREYVSREWIAEHTGASKWTVGTWYTKRDEQPEEARFPEKGVTIERVDYFERQAVERFYATHQNRKKAKVLPADPALHSGDPQELIPLNEAARLLGFTDGGVIRKYLSANPGYFPEPAGSLPAGRGQTARAFRRGDLQDFDRKRTNDTTGVSGRRPGEGTEPRGTSAETERRVTVAQEYLRETGGWKRGAGAALAARQGEPAWKWERAMKEARKRQESTSPAP
ncbi:hypothetical protein OG897_32380 [Streptomyces sp. NBC_00237]|uniref:hypothetical protein n=1 Tax=Streptomyces sp. NBC_00237 TaxID=2975687 RepID=UPI00225A0A9C|nr:hypothetical protein [Streptomyces sp. NBC_00237]MCX5206096.1 hypothetical protein [Streptomyces sp. NBC_00237]